MNIVQKAARMAWSPPDSRPPWQWAEQHYVVPVSARPGKWRSDNSPWVRQFMEDFADNRIRRITVLCSAQSAKTETMLVLLSWVIAEDPSPTMWVTSTKDEALKFWRERMEVSLKKCKPVAELLPDSRKLNKDCEVTFPTMTLEVVGANSKAELQSRSRRFLLLDEVRNWPSWALPMVLKRTRTWWNSRTVILTTPDKAHDTVHREFLDGSQLHYHVRCPSCGGYHQLKWGNLVWETSETTKPGGVWNFGELAKTLRYQCPQCLTQFRDEPTFRRELATGGKWVSHNPNAPEHLVSYTWNAMLPTWVPWASLLEEWITAQAALERGDPEPLKTFINESLGEPWEDRYRFARSEGYIEARVAEYDPMGPMPQGSRSFLSIDVQGAGGRHFYWVIRAVAPGGMSRLVGFGRAWSIEELRSVQIEYKIDPSNVLIDTGHFTSEVYRYIQESGVLPDGNFAWKAMKGDRAGSYTIEGVKQIFTWSYVDPYIGTSQQGMTRQIRQILYSKSSVLDRLDAVMHGVGPEWQILSGLDNLHEYKAQVTAYDRVEHRDSKGVVSHEWIQKRADDHWGSCERQILIAAIASGLWQAPAVNT